MAPTPWTSAKPDRDSKGIYHPDSKNTPEFADEFEAIPKPSDEEMKGRLDCSPSTMNYIKSGIAMHHIGIQDFYTQMAKKQWQAAKPSLPKAKPSPLPARLAPPSTPLARLSPMHLAKGMMAIGARRDLTANPMMVDKSRPLMPGGFATDWKLIPGLERVNAYVFRGDKRQPRLIKAADGFHPPSTRKDDAYTPVIARQFVAYMKKRFDQDVTQSDVEQYIRGQGAAGRVFVEYEIWREILKGEELHIGRMVQSEFLKGFISTTRDIRVANNFANGPSADGVGGGLRGVYALHSEGGFLLPPKGTHAHASANEAEIAHPGSLPWSKVKAFRILQVGDFNDARTWKTDESKARQVVFVRKGFREADPKGAKEVILALGGIG